MKNRQIMLNISLKQLIIKFLNIWLKKIHQGILRCYQKYNLTWHSGIRSEPINVNKTNEKQLWWQMYRPKEPYDPNKKKHEVKYTFNIGDRV